jgi:hypothetical protein
MKHRALAVLIGGLLVAACTLADGQEAPEGRYLEGMTYGPYRGRVVDAETKQPLEGAVVLAVWRQDKVLPLRMPTVRYTVREAVTDQDGRFVIDAKAVEEHAPRRTLHPSFKVFLPGYAAYNLSPFSARAYRQGEFTGEGATIGLSQLKTREERLQQIRSASPYDFSDDPFNDVPRFVEAVNRERASLHLQPYPPQKRKSQ